ncbi:phosphate ABC transporter substrate-binding/OmpA family protein [Loktanella sp. SALINAS62]|uniref:phosphate ABC transporter substrate-binding/OmpA family protein n=1 Tax=Loktanella sp. SALINAS62 TaxID=2706124 RepID=UPI001B8B327B|nr:phosphate ABC transporter substrate-binding/OmpA family protein [Loktanella sp. SALINAS62]MBS1302494.1 OmpA family protein [Loktanella sp. SALINAS62]
MKYLTRHATPLVAACLFFWSAAYAQDVTITSAQGGLELTGRIVSYDGTYLRIESDYGPLAVDYSRVTCRGDACPDPANFVPRLRVVGDRRLTEILLPALLDGFARAQGLSAVQKIVTPNATHVSLVDGQDVPVLDLPIVSSNSAEGFADIVAFQADAVLAFREASDQENMRAADVGLANLRGLGHVVVLGIDALVPIVSPVNPVRTIDPADLDAAFTGGLQTWPDGAALSLHLGPQSDGQVDAFLASLPDDPGAITFHTDAETLSRAVAADPGALGVTALNATGVAQALGLSDACGLTSAPRLAGVKTQDYPLTTPVFLTLAQKRQPQIVVDFLAFLRTPEAHLIIRRSGLMDLGVVPIPLDAQGGRLAHAITIAGVDTPLPELQRMVSMMHLRARSSLTFRFEVGGTTLDPVSSANLLTLAHNIRAGAYDGREILLMGFSDGEGPAAANHDLSAGRAEEIKSRLMAVLGDVPDQIRITTEAFGEALPIGCDDTERGRRMNRRVEVWIGD